MNAHDFFEAYNERMWDEIGASRNFVSAPGEHALEYDKQKPKPIGFWDKYNARKYDTCKCGARKSKYSAQCRSCAGRTRREKRGN